MRTLTPSVGRTVGVVDVVFVGVVVVGGVDEGGGVVVVGPTDLVPAASQLEYCEKCAVARFTPALENHEC
jgi:hypothetical protein